ncbi:hypothetical protein MKY37_17225 [Psychrobacillus sp. FSL K6-2836]|uniref:hypothetical protein n=1 Tax=Psychrobacillus sp. FSL K6-2836 TaxID=2921548 RepID=UPI0030F4F37B
MRYNTISLLLLLLLAGCSQNLGNPTARDVIKENEDADIFQWNDGLVYSNAANIEWIQELELTKGEELGEITGQTNKKWLFKDGVATQLPVGTKIYKANDDDTYKLIIELENTEIVYIALLEG